MEFKDRIKSLRIENDMSAAELATRLKKGESAVRMWELGRSKPDTDTLIEISKIFHCTTDYLLGLDENRDKESYTSNDELLLELAHRLAETDRTGDALRNIMMILRMPHEFIIAGVDGRDQRAIQSFYQILGCMTKEITTTKDMIEKSTTDINSYWEYVSILESERKKAATEIDKFFHQLFSLLVFDSTNKPTMPTDLVKIYDLYTETIGVKSK